MAEQMTYEEDRAQEHASWLRELLERSQMFNEQQLDLTEWLLAEMFRHGAKHQREERSDG